MSSPLKQRIIEDYTVIARRAENEGHDAQRKIICKPIYDPIKKEYYSTQGYLDNADLGLGCGFPVKYAKIIKGDVIGDLGCAAGIDSFLAREKTGPEGYVVGFDLTPELIEIATQNAKLKSFSNMLFRVADIENLPVENNFFDVLISNGVFSLLPDKSKVFQEMYRVLKPGGIFCIADITSKGEIDENLKQKVHEFTGCLNGISGQNIYVQEIQKAGFINIQIVNERELIMPETLRTEQGTYQITTIKAQKN